MDKKFIHWDEACRVLGLKCGDWSGNIVQYSDEEILGLILEFSQQAFSIKRDLPHVSLACPVLKQAQQRVAKTGYLPNENIK